MESVLQQILDPNRSLEDPNETPPFLKFNQWKQQAPLAARRTNDLSLENTTDENVQIFRQGDAIGNISGYLVSYTFGPTKTNPTPKIRIRACTNYNRKPPGETKWPPDARFFTAVYDSLEDITLNGYVEIGTVRGLGTFFSSLAAFLASFSPFG